MHCVALSAAGSAIQREDPNLQREKLGLQAPPDRTHTTINRCNDLELARQSAFLLPDIALWHALTFCLPHMQTTDFARPSCQEMAAMPQQCYWLWKSAMTGGLITANVTPGNRKGAAAKRRCPAAERLWPGRAPVAAGPCGSPPPSAQHAAVDPAPPRPPWHLPDPLLHSPADRYEWVQFPMIKRMITLQQFSTTAMQIRPGSGCIVSISRCCSTSNFLAAFSCRQKARSICSERASSASAEGCLTSEHGHSPRDY